jgi:hypothetical protein
MLCVLVLCFLLLLTACNSKSQFTKDLAQEIMDAFTEKDEEALFSLFSQELQEYPLAREQIQEAFNFIDGEIISYELPAFAEGGGKVIEEGKIMSENIAPIIYDIETDSGKRYQILFQYFIIFEYDKNREGLVLVSVFEVDENDKIIEDVEIHKPLTP